MTLKTERNEEIRRLLFVGEEVTLAHVTRPLVLAGALPRDKYEIHFACGGLYRTLIEEAGYRMHSLPSLAPAVFIDRLAKGQPLYTEQELASYVTAEKELVDRLNPDLIIGDFRLSLGITSVLCDKPYIAIANAHWSPHSTQPFPLPEHKLVRLLGVNLARRAFRILEPAIFWYHARPFNTLRKKYGLSVVGDLKHVYTLANATLYVDVPSLAPTRNLPAHQKYIGPVIWSPKCGFPSWWSELPEDVPLIYVTMGSSGDVSLLNRIVESVNGAGAIGLVATAGRTTMSAASRIYIAKYLPGLEVVKKAALVVCSGGSATAYQALSQGVPVLGIPSNADQFFTMESIENNGAGILLRPMDASVGSIQQAIKGILDNRSFGHAAQRLAQEISRFNAEQLFSDFIESWFENSLQA